MLYLELRSLFKARGIKSPHGYLVKNGFSYSAANHLMYQSPRGIKFDQLERLCELLRCEPNDLFVWKAESGVSYGEDFPLCKLKKSPIADDWMDVVAQLPMDELKELAKEVVEKRYAGCGENRS